MVMKKLWKWEEPPELLKRSIKTNFLWKGLILCLKNMVNALRQVIPRLVLVAFLLSLMFLVFGIGFTKLFANMYKNEHTSFDYFSSIDKSFLTLFQIMTFDNWHEIAREVMAVYPWSWILFVLWALITGFVIINLIVAIICESLVGRKIECVQPFECH